MIKIIMNQLLIKHYYQTINKNGNKIQNKYKNIQIKNIKN